MNRRIVATAVGFAGLTAAVAIPFVAATAASAEQDGVRLHGNNPASTILGDTGEQRAAGNDWNVAPFNKNW